jgi:hypothetical protein
MMNHTQAQTFVKLETELDLGREWWQWQTIKEIGFRTRQKIETKKRAGSGDLVKVSRGGECARGCQETGQTQLPTELPVEQ